MRRGITAVVFAYLWWGLSPIFWKIGEGVWAGDLIGIRIVAAAMVLALVHGVRRSGRGLLLAAREPRAIVVLSTTAVLLVSNWMVFIWALITDRVLESSLGYFLNPLVSVVLGVTVLRERLRPAQWGAVALAAAGVLVLSVDVGSPPWVSLFLAATFGLYGLLRKVAPVGSIDGLSIEVALATPIALAFVVVRTAGGDGVRALDLPVESLFAIGSGVVTVVPLVLFAYAARKIDLSLVGILQYIVPSMQFVLGVFVYDEPWSGGQAWGFVIIWVGLAVFAVDAFRSRRPRVLADG